MKALRRLVRRLTASVLGRRDDDRVREELAEHLTLLTEDYVRSGLPLHEAARRAELTLGALDATIEACRDEQRLRPLEDLGRDLRVAVRLMRRQPGFSLFAVLSLALAIGANATVFSAVDALLVRALPYGDADRLVRLYESHPRRGPRFAVSPGNFLSWRERSTVFEAMAIFRPRPFDLLGGSEPQRLDGAVVSPAFLRTLGLAPARGRDFRDDEESPHSAPVVMISHELWQSRFAGAADAVGRRIRLGDVMHTIVGILPAGFQFPAPAEIGAERVDVLAPATMAADAPTNRRNKSNRAVARMRAGVTLEQAQAEMQTVAVALAREFPGSNRDWRVTVVSLRSAVLGPMTRALPVALAMVTLVLLIACANVAGLLVVRGAGRTREYTVRLALGCTRARLVRQVLGEAFVLWSAATALGLAVAVVGRQALLTAVPQDLPGLDAVTISTRVVVYTLATAWLTAALFAILPVVQALRADRESTGFGSRTSGWATPRAFGHRTLAVLDAALATVVVCVAALLVTSFSRLQNVDPGFNPHGLVGVGVMPAPHRYREPEAMAGLYSRLLERFAELPGVRRVAVASFPPFVWGDLVFGYRVDGQTGPEPANWYAVSGSYFEVMGIPIRAGRTFADADGAPGAAPVAIISERLARLRFDGVDPIGRTIRIGAAVEPRTIVGVVGDTKHYGLDTATREQIYQPFATAPIDAMTFLVQSDVAPVTLMASLRQAVLAEDPEQTTARMRILEDVVAQSTARSRFLTLLVGLLGVVALLLAATGVYALLAYRVTHRQREVGIRMALGATAGRIVGLCLREGLTPLLIGLSLGIATALSLAASMEVLLFETSTREPSVYLVAVTLLCLIGLLASVVPARRAARLDPVGTLRVE
jgi:putative ABC transport system permease protein